VSKRGLIILGLVILFGVYFFVVGYEFLEKENALYQKKVKAAKDEQRRCEARNAKYRNFDQFRTSIRLPYTSDLPPERWMPKYDTVRAGMSESEVEIILGAPDYARCSLSEKSDRFVGSVWEYVVAVPQDITNNNQNSAIEVVFGPDGRLKDKSATNMQPKPGPTPSATATATPTPSGMATPVASPEVSATPAATPTATPQ
jgi:outer membrane protein assembly factor BamE (lipoprotein component of BamABCDE complex)